MLFNLSCLSVSVFICYTLLYYVSKLIVVCMNGLYNTIRIRKYLVFNFLFVCIWVFVSMLLVQRNFMESILETSYNHNIFVHFFISKSLMFDYKILIIYLCLVLSMLCLHILSVIDCIFKYVPNILLFLLFLISNIIYYLMNDFYDGYPFLVIGIVYVCYFMLHLFAKNEKLGQADIWVIACIEILLESFFNGFYYIFEVLICASLIGIFFNLVVLKKKYKENDSLDSTILSNISKIQLPFIPFLMFSFIIVSVLHVA